MLLKTASKRAIKKKKKQMEIWLAIRFADKIKKVSKTLTQNNSVDNIELGREIPRERYISLRKT